MHYTIPQAHEDNQERLDLNPMIPVYMLFRMYKYIAGHSSYKRSCFQVSGVWFQGKWMIVSDWSRLSSTTIIDFVIRKQA